MTDFDDFHNRIPKRLIAATFAASLLFDLIPFPAALSFWLPEMTALSLLYWGLNRPQSVGLFTAFACGLFLDTGIALPLGQHALAYVLMVFFIQKYQRRIILQSYAFQAVAVLIALTGSQLTLLIIRLISEHRLIGLSGLLAPVVGALAWPMLNKLMLAALNLYRRRR
ncbi:rod shape-determining protein MreD [Neisseria elongata]|jgi:rod shape-determining protein mreD|uniref:rod shape-determining protein MreD n=1 Tax=Neisseria elongata TaxID=495 RepID=UPI000D30B2DA|nr:rod shape-determining protein MreD [Neisseria elongata]